MLVSGKYYRMRGKVEMYSLASEEKDKVLSFYAWNFSHRCIIAGSQVIRYKKFPSQVLQKTLHGMHNWQPLNYKIQMEGRGNKGRTQIKKKRPEIEKTRQANKKQLERQKKWQVIFQLRIMQLRFRG